MCSIKISGNTVITPLESSDDELPKFEARSPVLAALDQPSPVEVESEAGEEEAECPPLLGEFPPVEHDTTGDPWETWGNSKKSRNIKRRPFHRN